MHPEDMLVRLPGPQENYITFRTVCFADADGLSATLWEAPVSAGLTKKTAMENLAKRLEKIAAQIRELAQKEE